MVVYQGVEYEGTHEALIDSVIWQKVQVARANNTNGDKQRLFRHNLKSTVWCGRCGSRLIVQMTTNRDGTGYPYLVRLGKQNKQIRAKRS